MILINNKEKWRKSFRKGYLDHSISLRLMFILKSFITSERWSLKVEEKSCDGQTNSENGWWQWCSPRKRALSLSNLLHTLTITTLMSLGISLWTTTPKSGHQPNHSQVTRTMTQICLGVIKNAIPTRISLCLLLGFKFLLTSSSPSVLWHAEGKVLTS